jgi:DNA-binding GntR family transcriptional regulator
VGRRSLLRDRAYQLLRARIVSGQLPPGTSLGEDRLAAELNVSRTPLRDAFRQLAEEGFVEHEPFKGVRVARLTPDCVREIFLIREALESVAAREACLSIPADALASMRLHFTHLQARIAVGDLSDVGDGIHDLLFEHCPNTRLRRLVGVYLAHVQWVQHYARSVPGRLVAAYQEHLALLSALEARDPELAGLAAATHIRRTLKDVLAALDSGTQAQHAG